MSDRFSFKDWSFWTFLKGRKKLLVTLIGAIGGYWITQSPALTAIIAAGVEMAYALLDYYLQP